jgi:16S rRNA C967 or C1407 C5-methylase (RsmB/RsmF family)
MLNLLHTFYNFSKFISKFNIINSQLDFDLNLFFKQNKNIGSKDRKFLTNIIYFYIRNQIYINFLSLKVNLKINQKYKELGIEYNLKTSKKLLEFTSFYISIVLLEVENNFISEIEAKYHFFDFKTNIAKLLNILIEKNIVTKDIISKDIEIANIEFNETITETIFQIINNELTEFNVTLNSIIESNFTNNKFEQNSLDNSLDILFEQISIKYSFPINIVKSIYNSINAETLNFTHLINTLITLNQKANVYFRAVDNVKNISIEFEKNQIQFKNYILPNCFVIEDNSNKKLTDFETFKKGDFEIQDFSSQLTFEFVKGYIISNIKQNNNINILDTCAGGGGKSLLFADEILNHFQNKNSNLNTNQHNFQIYSSDINSLRLDGLRLRLKKSKRKRNIFPEVINQTNNSKFNQFFDLAIIDAPCSGLGTNRRDVNIKYRISENKINEFQNIQINLINETKLFLKDDGIILYITCSLNYEENIGVVKFILENSPKLKPINIFKFCDKSINELLEKTLKDNFSLNDNNNFLTIFPHYFNSDGFFVALFQKV